MTATALPPLRDVIRRHGLNARKSLGQHFLLDSNLTNRIVRSTGDLTDYHVVEIGPGPGGLTRALLQSPAATVHAIEKDERCLAVLHELQEHFGDRLRIVSGDALDVDIPDLVPAPRKIVANLPYNVGTPLLLKWLRQVDAFDGLTLMFQAEVADRLCADPRTKAYGRLSVITQWLCQVRTAFNVSKDAFTPPPKVASSVVDLRPFTMPSAEATFESLEAVTAAAFGQRRKMLRASLKSLNLDLESIQIDPTARAEELSVEEFCALARLHQAAH